VTLYVTVQWVIDGRQQDRPHPDDAAAVLSILEDPLKGLPAAAVKGPKAIRTRIWHVKDVLEPSEPPWTIVYSVADGKFPTTGGSTRSRWPRCSGPRSRTWKR